MTTSAVHKAIYDKLRLNAGIVSLVSGVYEHVPPGTPMPYLLVGEVRFQPTDYLSEMAGNVYVTLHAWDDYKGSIRAQQIESAVRLLLHRQPLTATGLKVLQVVIEESMAIPEDRLRHLIMEVRVMVEPS
jgi:hypothetical protein